MTYQGPLNQPESFTRGAPAMHPLAAATPGKSSNANKPYVGKQETGMGASNMGASNMDASNMNTSGGPLQRLKVGDTWIEYQVRRSRKRTKTYQVSVKSGQVLVAVPYRITNKQAEEMVLAKAAWILSKLAAESAEPPAPTLLSGERLPYCGGEVTLWVEGVDSTASGRPEVSLDGQRLRVTVPVGLSEAERRQQVAMAVSGWYGERAAEQIWVHLLHWWPRMGKGHPPNIRIRNQRRRWGSCSRDGVLRFNWRLAMLEASLTEYVVVHELAHLTHMNHSADFWGLVEEHLPNVKERRRWLREAGRTLPELLEGP